jgi:pimeloyl-ACP methyl ester carboxylesterase
MPNGYLEDGDQHSAKTLVLIHAFPVGVRIWEPFEAPAGWRAIAPALPGFDGVGRIDHPPASIDDYARAVLATMDRLGMSSAIVGGLSMGGYVAFALWRLAARRCRGLLLADTRAGADTDEGRAARNKLLDLVQREGSRAVGREMVSKLLGEYTRRTRLDLVAHVTDLTARQTPEGIADAIVSLRDREDSTPLLSTIDVPTLILVGEEDVATPPAEAEAMRSKLAHALLERIPAAGHLSILENPATFNAAVARFLERFFP